VIYYATSQTLFHYDFIVYFVDLFRAALLGSVGLDLPRVAHKLDVLSAISNFEPLEPIRETDIRAWQLAGRQQGMIRHTNVTHILSSRRLCWKNMVYFMLDSILNVCI